MRNECLDAALEELRLAGVNKRLVVRGGKHIQVQWQCNGAIRFYVLPVTSSDVRAVANTRAGVRRLLRADGLLQPEEEATPRPKPLSLEQRVRRLEQRLEQLTERPGSGDGRGIRTALPERLS
jgi:hypothetical protein